MNASARPSRPVGNTKTLSLSQSPTITPIRASSGPNNRAMAAVPGGKAVDWSGILLRRDAGRDSTLVDVYQSSACLGSTGSLACGAGSEAVAAGRTRLDRQYTGRKSLTEVDSVRRRRHSVRGSTRRCPSDTRPEPKSRVVTLTVRILPKQYSACLRMTASSRKACPSPDDYLEHYCSAASGPKAWGAESAATEYSRACQRTRRMSSTTRRLVIRRRRALCYPWSVAAGG